MHFYFKAIGYLLAYPVCYVLCGRVKWQYFIQRGMVEFVFYHTFYVAEVGYHTVGVQLFRTAVYCDNPVVSVQMRAFAFVRKFQPMSG